MHIYIFISIHLYIYKHMYVFVYQNICMHSAHIFTCTSSAPLSTSRVWLVDPSSVHPTHETIQLTSCTLQPRTHTLDSTPHPPHYLHTTPEPSHGADLRCSSGGVAGCCGSQMRMRRRVGTSSGVSDET